MQLEWLEPQEKELQMAQELIDEFLATEIESLQSFIKGNLELKREQIQNSLDTIKNIIIGASHLLPNVCDDEKITLAESQVDIKPMKCRVRKNGAPELTFKGSNLRESVIAITDQLQKHLLEHHVDDHKSLHSIGKIYDCALHYYGITRQEYEHRYSDTNLNSTFSEIRFCQFFKV